MLNLLKLGLAVLFSLFSPLQVLLNTENFGLSKHPYHVDL